MGSVLWFAICHLEEIATSGTWPCFRMCVECIVMAFFSSGNRETHARRGGWQTEDPRSLLKYKRAFVGRLVDTKTSCNSMSLITPLSLLLPVPRLLICRTHSSCSQSAGTPGLPELRPEHTSGRDASFLRLSLFNGTHWLIASPVLLPPSSRKRLVT